MVPVGMMMMSFMAQSIGVRPSRPSAVKESAYEGGMPPFGGRPARFNFRYYYYALLWVWTQAWGTGAVALRSLSALAGTACIPLGAALAAVAA